MRTTIPRPQMSVTMRRTSTPIASPLSASQMRLAWRAEGEGRLIEKWEVV